MTHSRKFLRDLGQQLVEFCAIGLLLTWSILITDAGTGESWSCIVLRLYEEVELLADLNLPLLDQVERLLAELGDRCALDPERSIFEALRPGGL